MGWTASGDPFAHIRLRFPDRQSAIEFAERHGWQYELRDPPVRRFRPESYAANFRYQLAAAIGRVGPRWDGSVQITDRRESGRRAEVADSARPSAARREAAPVEGAA
jgi:ETC complex I subunit conserved region